MTIARQQGSEAISGSVKSPKPSHLRYVTFFIQQRQQRDHTHVHAQRHWRQKTKQT